MSAPTLMGRCSIGLRALALILLLAWGPGHDAVRAQPASGDAAAKAKFTITLARFVHWPAGPASGDAGTLRLCALHNSAAVAEAFALLDGQRVAGRTVAVALNPKDLGACVLVYVDSSAAHGSALAIAAAGGASSLTLGAVDGFLSQGGMIELTIVNDALRFDVNLRALRSAHVELSSQVLKLARQVRE